MKGALLLAALLFTSGAMTVDFDELKCEAAMARLAECCPAFNPGRHTCSREGCDAGSLPDLAADESDCIVALDCDAIVARKLCAAVDALPENMFDNCPGYHGCGSCPSSENGPPLNTVHPPVCR